MDTTEPARLRAASWSVESPYEGIPGLWSDVSKSGVKVRSAFSREEYHARMSAVLKTADEQGLDAICFSVPDSIYYLVGFQTPGDPVTMLIVPSNRAAAPRLFTRGLEASNARYRSTVDCESYTEGQAAEKCVATYLKALGAKTVGYESTSPRLTVRSQRTLEALHPAGWVDVSSLVLNFRSVKSPNEMEHMRRAAALVEDGMRAGVRAIRPGVTETEIAGEMQRAMMRNGAEYASYPAFVSSGATGCLGHHAASRNTVKEGEIVFIELGACCNRYHAARMHTVFVGSEPPEWYLDAEARLQRATEAGRRAAVPGTKACEVDAAMRAHMHGFPLPYWMSTRSGYGIGTGLATDWSERNMLIDPSSTDVTREGMTLHLIPWIQLPEVGAMGYSDTCVVAADGAHSLFDRGFPRYYERAIRTLKASPAHDVAMEPELMERARKFHRSTVPTPLVTRTLAGGPTVHIKDETSRMGVRAFKILGVSYAIDRLVENGQLHPRDTVASMTDGNHGEALAVVARQRGHPCVVLVPHNVCADRVAVLRALGASVHTVSGSYDDCIARLRTDAAEHGWVIVADTSWEGYDAVPTDIMCGYTTLFAEALAELPEPPTHCLVQAGVGGLLGAAAMCLSALAPDVQIVSIEPVDAACILENAAAARNADDLAECDGATDSNMQGLNCGVPSAIAWPHIVGHVSSYVAIGDEWAREAVRELYHKHRLSVSESGAAGYAGLLASIADGSLGIGPDSRVLIILTEGVTNVESFNDIIGSTACTTTAAQAAALIGFRCGIDVCMGEEPNGVCEALNHSAIDGLNADGPTMDLIMCPVCLGPLVGPISLACSHSMCSGCATQCGEKGHRNCPVCRTPHLLNPKLLGQRLVAYRREYARWRTGGSHGAVGEVSVISKPICEGDDEGDDSNGVRYSRAAGLLHYASPSYVSKSTPDLTSLDGAPKHPSSDKLTAAMAGDSEVARASPRIH